MSYNLGDKLTKTLTGLGDFDFTCVEVNNTNAYFICDEIVSKQVFNSDTSKGNDYATSDLKAYVDDLGVEGLTIPTKKQLEKWYSSDSKRIARYNGTNTSYWTSSAYSPVFNVAYGVNYGSILIYDVRDTHGVRPCFVVVNTSTKPKIKLGTLVKAWKTAYTPSTPSLEIGVSKMTKNILGTDYGFTYVGDKDGQAVFMCDTTVEDYKFDDTTQVYENSALKAKVATYGSEYFIPTVQDIANWTDTDISTLALEDHVDLNSNSPMYNFAKGTKNYWTSSACPDVTSYDYAVSSYGSINYGRIDYIVGVRPCFAISK